MIYAKIFSSLWCGSLRGQPHNQLVMIYLLAHADQDGVVDVIVDRIIDDTGLEADEVHAALRALEDPDEDSRTPDDDGRRIRRLYEHRPWGWRIVNFDHYRALRNQEDRRRQNREAQATRRDRLRSANVSNRQQPSAESAHTDTDTETDVDPCVASQRAPSGRAGPRASRGKATPAPLPDSREALYALHSIDELAGRLIDEYLGLGARDEEPWQLQARATLLASPDWQATVGTLRVPQEVLEQAEGNRARVLDLVKGIVDKKRMDGPALPPAVSPSVPQRIHVGMVYELTKKLGKAGQHTALQLTQRIFNAGVTSPAVLTAVAKHYVDHYAGIRNPFAYYSPGGEGFEFIRMRVGAEASIAEHQALERATRDWLTPPTAAEQAAG